MKSHLLFGTLLVMMLLQLTTIVYGQEKMVITNVNVIPMNKNGVLRNQTVLIENGMIKKIGDARKITAPPGAITVDGSGKYLMPGLFDMHTHFFYEQGNNVNSCPEELKLMIANGLTTARINTGDSAYLHTREMVKKNMWPGPELIVTSPQIVGSWPWMGKIFAGICKTPAQGEQFVRQYKAQGYDQIKLTFMVKPDVYDAIIKTAKEENIKVVGHVGPLVKLPKALEAKQQIEHMDEFIDMLLPDTSYNHGQSVSDMNLWRKAAWATVPHLDEKKIPALVKRVKDAGIYVTPTNYFFYSFFGAGIDSLDAISHPDYAYIPSVLKEVAWDVRKKYLSNAPSEESRKKYIYLRSKMIRELWKAGVPLMAGSDSPQWFSVSGFALHDELENLVASGLTPYAALQTATINPARFLGFDKRTGTIEEGKEADLILLDKNPLEDIRNTRRINGVMINKTYFDRKKLDQLLDEAKVLSR